MLNVFIQNKNAPTFCNTFGILYMFLSSHYNHTSTYMTCMKTNDMVIENFSYSNSTNTTGVKEQYSHNFHYHTEQR